jgi:CelD/BcsL family acetyltransferase involved in cellulose biosynthesis
MVDATASFDGKAGIATGPHPLVSQASISATIAPAHGESLSAYRRLCESALFAPAQSPQWIENWIAETKPDAFLATLEIAGRPALGLALEVVRSGPFRIAGFMSGRHANGNFVALDPTMAGELGPAAFKALASAIHWQRPDIDLIALERLLPDMEGVANPLLALPNFPSPNISLAVDLDGGFETLLARVSGKRKRKKHRSQTRKFEAAGGFNRIEAGTEPEVRRVLDAFFSMKQSRFLKMGITDVFAPAEVKAFFLALFSDALRQDTPPFVLHALEVAGKIRAVTGSSRSGSRLICEFGAIAEDDLGHTSPGDFLFFDNIEEACNQGFGVYDFSVGDEHYKRLWCDVETRHGDVLVPLTAKGQALAFSIHQRTKLKSFVKNNQTIWKFVKLMRRNTAGKQALPAESED